MGEKYIMGFKKKKQHSNDGETQVSLPIEGMTCASCVGRVEAALAKVEGVQSVSVNLATERADIRLNTLVNRMALVEAVEKVGYEVPSFCRVISSGHDMCIM